MYLDCKIDQRASVTQQSKEVLWHQRYSHLNVQSLQKLARQNLVKGLDLDHTKDIDFCETYIKGKHKKSVFPMSESHRAAEPLDLFHSDVCGKINVRSLGGAEYFLTFIDDRTHYTWVYILKHKDEVFDCFLRWKALVEKSSGRKLKAIRTDNGGEYTSTMFGDYLKSEGIRHERTVPETPEQNCVAERMNLTLVETVRSTLTDAKLPHKFWGEALSSVVYLRNRSPTKAVKEMTPYEAWTTKKLSVGHLRVFGRDAYAHIPKDEIGKLDPKAKKCIFVGYGEETKGYRLYDVVRAKIMISRDVVFNEGNCEFLGLKDASRYVELELSSDNDTPTIVELPQVEQQAEEIDHRDTLTGSALDAPTSSQPRVRRSTRQRQTPDYFGWEANLAGSQMQEPHTVEEAKSTIFSR